jgi:type IV pilus assembly protein PilW
MRARGFSLIELLVAMAVSLIVVAAAVSLLIGTQRLFQTGTEDRALQETARVAMGELVGNLAMAGYGLDPTFAFDFGQANTIMDRIPIGDQARFGGYDCANPAVCRDSITGPDELVFYARDPMFGKDLTGPVGASSITLVGPVTNLNPGQVLQIMCYGGSSQWYWAYVSVAKVDQSNPLQVAVTLTPSPGLAYDFPYQNQLLTEKACFGAGVRRAFKIDRYRYFIATIDAAGNVQPWQTPGARPYLMLDQGLSDANGPVSVPIAPDVEDLQVSYVFPLADAASGQQLVGATSGVRVDASATGIDLAPALGIPAFSTPSLDPIRTTHHPANIRAVRVAITVRSGLIDPKLPDAAVPAALNRPDVPGEAGYRRLVFESTAATHNLESRLPVFPIYDPNNTSGNIAGG